MLDGAAAGLSGVVKVDTALEGGRRVELWQSLQAQISIGDRFELKTGCDKRPETCRQKFDNFINYRGFPAIPGEDWLMAYPSEGIPKDGGSL